MPQAILTRADAVALPRSEGDVCAIGTHASQKGHAAAAAAAAASSRRRRVRAAGRLLLLLLQFQPAFWAEGGGIRPPPGWVAV